MGHGGHASHHALSGEVWKNPFEENGIEGGDLLSWTALVLYEFAVHMPDCWMLLDAGR